MRKRIGECFLSSIGKDRFFFCALLLSTLPDADADLALALELLLPYLD